MPLRTWNGVSGPLEQRRASSGSGAGVTGVSQPSPTPADRQPESPRPAAVNGARQLPHKAELEVCVQMGRDGAGQMAPFEVFRSSVPSSVEAVFFLVLSELCPCTQYCVTSNRDQ